MSPFGLTEITGDAGHYFTIAELRASDDAFVDAVKYPDVDCDAAREWAEQRFETLARISYIARTGAVHSAIGNGDAYLTLPHNDLTAVTSVTIAGVALTAAELADLVVYPYGLVKRAAGWTEDAAIVVTYNYGKTVVPSPVKKALLLLCREYLVSNLASRATSETTDIGFIRLSIAQPGRTGIPEVDAVIADYGHGPTFVG